MSDEMKAREAAAAALARTFFPVEGAVLGMWGARADVVIDAYLAAHGADEETRRNEVVITARQVGKTAQMVEMLLAIAAERRLDIRVIEPPPDEETVTTVEELPIGSVFWGYYYPKSYDLPPRKTELARVQLTRGRSIAHGERMEYPLGQSWERIEVLYRPTPEGSAD